MLDGCCRYSVSLVSSKVSVFYLQPPVPNCYADDIFVLCLLYPEIPQVGYLLPQAIRGIDRTSPPKSSSPVQIEKSCAVTIFLK
jgi:hypothetical protein